MPDPGSAFQRLHDEFPKYPETTADETAASIHEAYVLIECVQDKFTLIIIQQRSLTNVLLSLLYKLCPLNPEASSIRVETLFV